MVSKSSSSSLQTRLIHALTKAQEGPRITVTACFSRRNLTHSMLEKSGISCQNCRAFGAGDSCTAARARLMLSRSELCRPGSSIQGEPISSVSRLSGTGLLKRKNLRHGLVGMYSAATAASLQTAGWQRSPERFHQISMSDPVVLPEGPNTFGRNSQAAVQALQVLSVPPAPWPARHQLLARTGRRRRTSQASGPSG